MQYDSGCCDRLPLNAVCFQTTIKRYYYYRYPTVPLTMVVTF